MICVFCAEIWPKGVQNIQDSEIKGQNEAKKKHHTGRQSGRQQLKKCGEGGKHVGLLNQRPVSDRNVANEPMGSNRPEQPK